MEQLIKDTLKELLQHLGLSFTEIRVDATDPQMTRVDIDSPEASRLIGWHGETINALQWLLKSLIRAKEDALRQAQGKGESERGPFIVLDVDGYRRAQEEKVCKIARDKADFVRRKQTRVALPPMSPYFRRVVHLYIANDPTMSDLTTESIGEGEYRQIVLKLKQGVEDGKELTPVIAKEETPMEKDILGLDNLDV